MTTTGAPRWLELQFEGDFCMWRLNQIIAELGQPKSPVEALIDQAVDRQASLEAESKELMQQFDAIRAELNELIAASDSPPGAVGLGLVPPERPNPTDRGAP